MEKKFYVGFDSQNIALRQSVSGDSACILLLAHDLAEHSGRYGALAEKLNREGIGFVGVDLRAHGDSISGKRGEADSAVFTKTAEDIAGISDYCREKHSLPVVRLGVGYGALAVLQSGQLGKTDGMILSGLPHIGAAESMLFQMYLSYFTGEFDSKFPNIVNERYFDGFDREFKGKYGFLTDDPGVSREYEDDASSGFELSAGFWYSYYSGAAQVLGIRSLEKIGADTPVLVINGSQDVVGGRGKAAAKLCKKLKKCGFYDLNAVTVNTRHDIFHCKESYKAEQAVTAFCRKVATKRAD